MIETIVKDMSDLVNDLKSSINQDILDVKEAKHEELLKRNDDKHYMLDKITNLKIQLNKELVVLVQEGKDVNIYRKSVDLLEIELKELYELNKKLASIVLPVQRMYKELVEEIITVKGGQLFDIKA
jgi:chemotaxis response regulator CheB